MKRILFFALGMVILSGVSTSAVASGWEFGVKGGISEGTGDFNDAFQSAYVWGVYYEYLFTPAFSLQAKYGRHVHDVSADFKRFANAAVEDDINLVGDISINEFVLNLKFTLPLAEKWRWFLLGGVGAYIWELDLAQDTAFETPLDLPGADGTDFGVNGGTGIAYMFNPEVGLGLEADYTYIYGDFDEGYFSFFLNAIFRFGKDLYK